MIYQSEKTVADFGDKLTEDEKNSVKTACDALREALKGDDSEAIKAKQEELQKAVYAISEKVYKEAQAAGATPDGAADNAAPNADNVYDAEFTEADNN